MSSVPYNPRTPFSKYKNRVTTTHGFSFPSKLEAAVYEILLGQKEKGLIADIKTQVNVYLTAARLRYIVDFSATDLSTGHTIYIEAKGFEVKEWRRNLRLWKAGYGPGKLLIYKGSYKRPYLADTVIPAVLTDELW